jgi:Kinetochore complex Fta4 of Sim4 subunit, or CENP-50
LDEYAELYQTLKNLSEQRENLLRKVETYQALRDKLTPLQNPQQSVQPNLVNRDAALNEELASSKRLGLRIASQAAGMKRRRDDEGTTDSNTKKQERTKLLAALSNGV